jgi:hypothetical protein
MIITNMIAAYLTKYGKFKLFAFHWSFAEFVDAILQLNNAYNVTILLTCPFRSSTYPYEKTPNTSIIICLLITYTLSK